MKQKMSIKKRIKVPTRPCGAQRGFVWGANGKEGVKNLCIVERNTCYTGSWVLVWMQVVGCSGNWHLWAPT